MWALSTSILCALIATKLVLYPFEEAPHHDLTVPIIAAALWSSIAASLADFVFGGTWLLLGLAHAVSFDLIGELFPGFMKVNIESDFAEPQAWKFIAQLDQYFTTALIISASLVGNTCIAVCFQTRVVFYEMSSCLSGAATGLAGKIRAIRAACVPNKNKYGVMEDDSGEDVQLLYQDAQEWTDNEQQIEVIDKDCNKANEGDTGKYQKVAGVVDQVKAAKIAKIASGKKLGKGKTVIPTIIVTDFDVVLGHVGLPPVEKAPGLRGLRHATTPRMDLSKLYPVDERKKQRRAALQKKKKELVQHEKKQKMASVGSN